MKGLWLAADGSIRQTTQLLKEFRNELFGVKAHALTDPAARDRIKLLRSHGSQWVWVDIKGHDTPDTVAKRAETLRKCGADYITVHASGGLSMMRQTVETGIGVYAVVYLTSLTPVQFNRYYQPDAVKNMIEDAVAAGVTGFICPPTKVVEMRNELQQYGSYFDIISPGTRFVDGSTHDQEQVETPGVTVRNGADFLVIGRMLTEAKNKRSRMDRILAEIREAA